jgi:Ser/Thr protein kinase RdoA (MazF antagonist)
LVDGDTLLHTDMTHNNFLIDGHQVHVADWSMPCRGAVWLDTARMLVRLIRAGHTPEQAERWAADLPTWADTTPGAIDAFAAALVKTSRRLRDNRPDAPHLAELADATNAWFVHRSRRQ